MGMIAISTFLLGMSAPLQEPPAAAPPARRGDEPIVVDGERIDPREPVEEPYSETERVPLGSRIPRRVDRRPYNTVASDSGLAGMISGPGINYDATGGSGGTPLRVRNRQVRECRAANERVSEATACILFRVQQHIDRREFAEAGAKIDELLGRRTLPGVERYYAATYSYRLAQAADDDARRESALTTMLAGDRMPAADRPGALRTLALLAARRGDDAAAAARLEQAIALAPQDPRNHADLAWIYARLGRDSDALPRMRTAVQLARQTGADVPQTWLEFLAGDP
jgi:hypothetical protein